MCSTEPRSNANTKIASQLQLQRQYMPQLKAKRLSDVFLFLCQLKYRRWMQFAVHFAMRRASILRFPKNYAWSFVTYLSAAKKPRQFIARFDWMNATVREKWQVATEVRAPFSKFYLYYQPECRILYVRRRKVGPQICTAECMHASQPKTVSGANVI